MKKEGKFIDVDELNKKMDELFRVLYEDLKRKEQKEN